MTAAPTLARRLWEAIEPVHAVVYFAPEPVDAARQIGLRGFWMGYFAGRVAPLGPVSPEVATALVYGFAPTMVSRALPDAWHFADPATVVSTRVASAGEALRHHLDPGASAALAELSDLLWEAVAGCRFDGRALSAGWSQVARPADAATSAWLAATILREHRGDGHVLAAVAHDLSGLDATLTLVGTGALDRGTVQPHRGWTDGDWDRAAHRLRAIGVLDTQGRLTDTGQALRAEVEALTDQLAAAPLDGLGRAGVERAIELAAPLSRHLVDHDVVPVPNPMGAPRP